MTTKLSESTKIDAYHFDSMADMLADQEAYTGYYHEDIDALGVHFTGVKSLSEARALARDGWPEGLRAMQATGLKANLNSANGRKYRRDVAGNFVSQAHFAAGDPCHMVRKGSQFRAGRNIRLVVNIGVAAKVSNTAITNYGAAIAAIVDAVEGQGAQVDLYAFDISLTPGRACAVNVKVKSAGEPLDRAKVFYAMAHPSMLRRHFFDIFAREKHRYLGHSLGTPANNVDRQTLKYVGMDTSDLPVPIPNLDFKNARRAETPQGAIKLLLERVGEAVAKHGLDLSLDDFQIKESAA